MDKIEEKAAILRDECNATNDDYGHGYRTGLHDGYIIGANKADAEHRERLAELRSWISQEFWYQGKDRWELMLQEFDRIAGGEAKKPAEVGNTNVSKACVWHDAMTALPTEGKEVVVVYDNGYLCYNHRPKLGGYMVRPNGEKIPYEPLVDGDGWCDFSRSLTTGRRVVYWTEKPLEEE